ncbi:MAG: hypothetical protein NC543_02930 [bacterium]|nr:hypothetical protein [bacterium]MCM1375572.1 hypothetical protein [Muribaculum sp.]
MQIPRSLHELLDYGGASPEVIRQLERLVPECPLHILDLNQENDYSGFRTSLRTVFELYACRTDKKRFREYVESHEECRHLDEETYAVIGQMVRSEELLEVANDRGKAKEERDMCKAIKDLIADGRAEERTAIIGSVMQKLHCSLEEACEIAGISVQEYRQAQSCLTLATIGSRTD